MTGTIDMRSRAAYVLAAMRVLQRERGSLSKVTVDDVASVLGYVWAAPWNAPGAGAGQDPDAAVLAYLESRGL